MHPGLRGRYTGAAAATIEAVSDGCPVGTVTTAQMRIWEVARRNSDGPPPSGSLGAPCGERGSRVA